MNKIEVFKKELLLSHRVKLIYQVSFPRPEGKDKREEEEMQKTSEFLGDVLLKQYKNNISSIISGYENSLLPIKFTENQKLYALCLGTNIRGIFDGETDDIFVDINCLSGIYSDTPANFIFGHEIGHKIEKYKSSEETYKEIASILGISYATNREILREVFADECGSIVSQKRSDCHVLRNPLELNKINGIKRLILKTAYME